MQHIYKKSITLTVLLIFFLLTCTKKEEELEPREYPSIDTNQVKEINKEGATLSAVILSLGNSAVIDHGFVYGKSPSLRIERSNYISLGAIDQAIEFSSLVNINLEKDRRYYVRAYTQTTDVVVYGQEVKFISAGDSNVELVSFEPKEGVIGDTITIIGEGFSNIISNNYIRFKNTGVLPLKASQDTLVVVVPEGTPIGNITISVNVGQRLTSFSDKFIHKVSEILQIIPAVAKSYDTIKVIGENYGYRPELLTVRFNNKANNIISLKNDTINVVVPSGLNNPVNIKIDRREVTSEAFTGFEYLKPYLTSFSPSNGTIYDTLIIYGGNFQSRNNLDSLFLNGFMVDIFKNTNSTIKAIIPAFINVVGSNETPQLEIGLNSSGATLMFDNPFVINPFSVKQISPIIVNFLDPIVINGTGFHPEKDRNFVTINDTNANIISGSSSQLTIEVPSKLQFDSTASLRIDINTLGYHSQYIDSVYFRLPKIIDIAPLEVFDENQAITITGENLSGMNDLKVLIAGFECNILTTSPTEITFTLPVAYYTQDNINTTRSDDIKILINNIFETGYNKKLVSIIKYLPWTKMTDFPGDGRNYGYTFAQNDKIYAGGGENDQGVFNDLWQFDPSVNVWSKKNDFPGVKRSRAMGTTLNGTGYIGFGQIDDNTYLDDLWKYDALLDNWQQMPSYPLGPRSQVLHFSANNVFHVVAGKSRDASDRETAKEHASFSGITWSLENNFIPQDNHLLDTFKIRMHEPQSSILSHNNVLYQFITSTLKAHEYGGWRGDHRIHIYKNNQANTWDEQIEIKSNLSADKKVFLINNSFLFVMSGPYTQVSIIEYDPANNTSELVSRLPGDPKWGITSLSFNNKLYVMLGREYQGNSPQNYSKEVWEFDPSKL